MTKVEALKILKGETSKSDCTNFFNKVKNCRNGEVDLVWVIKRLGDASSPPTQTDDVKYLTFLNVVADLKLITLKSESKES